MCHDTFWWGGTPPYQRTNGGPSKSIKKLDFLVKKSNFWYFLCQKVPKSNRKQPYRRGRGGYPPYLSK